MRKLLLKSHCSFSLEEEVLLLVLLVGRYVSGSRVDCDCLIRMYCSQLSWGPAQEEQEDDTYNNIIQ